MAGSLLIIGGSEEKEENPTILRALVKRIGKGKLVVATVASEIPDELWETYEKVFVRLGLSEVVHLDIRAREDALSEERASLLEGATGVLFTGGDQLRITSRIGRTPLQRHIEEVFHSGGIVAGTSAGAAVMSEVMLVRGAGARSYRSGSDRPMAPDFGFLKDVIVDQHFTERSRIGRLLGAVAENPRFLGIGLDEDTAVLAEGDELQVLGSGAAYILDGTEITRSNLTEAVPNQTLSIFGLKLHVLSAGDIFHVSTRSPRPASPRAG